MTTEEILKAATPRPWRNRVMGSEGCRIFPDSGNIHEDVKFIAMVNGRALEVDKPNGELIVIAVNSFESDRAKIEALVSVVEQLKSLLDDRILIRNISRDDDYNRFIIEGGRVTKMVLDGIAALKLAGGE